jgi:hypothetical protein
MARTLSPSITFKREVAKMVAKKNLPDATTDMLVQINKELDEAEDEDFDNQPESKSNIPNAGRTYIGAGGNEGGHGQGEKFVAAPVKMPGEKPPMQD